MVFQPRFEPGMSRIQINLRRSVSSRKNMALGLTSRPHERDQDGVRVLVHLKEYRHSEAERRLTILLGKGCKPLYLWSPPSTITVPTRLHHALVSCGKWFRYIRVPVILCGHYCNV